MPLIIVTGHPASGKTTRSQVLADALNTIISTSTNPAHKPLTIKIINDESLGLSRSSYAVALTEKQSRGAFSSAIKRALSPTTIVIADGLNYIKGFRYQLYCEAKALQTPSCCLHVATTPEYSSELNAKVAEKNSGTEYAADLLENLIFRYEEPSGFARWDSPLFTLPVDSKVPAREIFEAIVGGLDDGGTGKDASKGDGTVGKDAAGGGLKRVRANLATVAPVQTDADALQKVDGLCGAVVRLVMEWQKERGTEAEADVPVGEAESGQAVVKLPVGGFSTASIQRLRREFVGLIRGNPGMARRAENSLRAEFVSYINRRTWEDG